jgi:hypothetical protein
VTGEWRDDVVPAAVRPFLDRGRALGRVADPDPADSSVAGVRAFAITRGRAHAVVHLEFETMLQATAAGGASVATQRFERLAILQRCIDEPLSVAELSALLRLPIGVVRVMAADLLAEGLLQAYQPSEHVADDVFLLTRLIAGVRAL